MEAIIPISNCGGPHSAAYGGCPRYRQEAKIKSVMTSQNMDYWTARQLVQNQTATIPPNIASESDFPSLPRTSTNISPPQRKNPHTALRLSPSQPRLATTRINSDTTSDDIISLSSAKFFEFIADVIKDTLTEFSKNKNVDVDAIIVKSANARLGIQAPLRKNKSHLHRKSCPRHSHGTCPATFRCLSWRQRPPC